MKKSTEIFNGEEDIEEAEHTKYLGQIISKDGTNMKNPAYGRHQLSQPMRIVGPIQI